MALSLLFSGFKFRQVEIKIQKYDRYWINVRRIVIRHFSSGIRSQSYDVMSLLNTVYNAVVYLRYLLASEHDCIRTQIGILPRARFYPTIGCTSNV